MSNKQCETNGNHNAFFDFDGNEISVKEFVDLYSKEYFFPCDNSRDSKKYIKGLNRTSCFVEFEVMKILEHEIKNKEELEKVLAWKMGRIKQKDSQKQKKVCFYRDWKPLEGANPKLRGKELDLNSFSEFILDNIKNLSELAENNPQECLIQLKDNSVDGIGTVYLITILFFLSKGNQPIYDRFAQEALNAYRTGSRKNTVGVKELPDKKSKRFCNLVENGYGEYKKMLEELKEYGVDYRNDRNVDRALWVYGHIVKGDCKKSIR